MDCSGGVRGLKFPTHLVARCPAYEQCLLCGGCNNYNPHARVCNYCESRLPNEAKCRHTDEQQFTVVRISEIMKMPMAHVDKKATPVNIPIAENPDWESVVNGAFDGPGAISPIKEK